MSISIYVPKFDLAEITSNKPTVVLEVVDQSGSMDAYIREMRNALSEHQREILNLDEVNSIRFLRVDFADVVNFSDYEHMKNFSTSYQASGGTALYAAIHYAARSFFDERGIYEAFIEAGKEPNIIVSCFSDGEDTTSIRNYGVDMSKARAAIERFNDIGATTAFVGFNQGVSIGQELGFQACKSYHNKEGLSEAFERISMSVGIISRSKAGLGKNFFDDV